VQLHAAPLTYTNGSYTKRQTWHDIPHASNPKNRNTKAVSCRRL
jgi:hypothetical protein